MEATRRSTLMRARYSRVNRSGFQVSRDELVLEIGRKSGYRLFAVVDDRGEPQGRVLAFRGNGPDLEPAEVSEEVARERAGAAVFVDAEECEVELID